MDKSYSVLIVSRLGSPIRNLVVSRSSIRILACALLTLLGLNAWLLGDYFRMRLEQEEMKTLGAQLNEELATLRARVRSQSEKLSSVKESAETGQGLIAKLRLERNDYKVQESQLNEQMTALSARYKEELAMSAKHREEVAALKAKHRQKTVKMNANHKEEVTTLREKHNGKLRTLKVQVELQREKLLALQEQAKASQQLLANWKGLRKKIRDSLPRRRKSALTGQQIVGELETSLASLQGDIESLIASIPSEWPIDGWISSRYGRRHSPWTGKAEFHAGIDIANRQGTPVHASGDGLVKFAGRKASNGKIVVLDHGQGITTHYAHLSKIHVKKGDSVQKNQKIANVGNTGKSTNPHLHYEVRINGTPVNPRRHLLNQKPPSPKEN